MSILGGIARKLADAANLRAAKQQGRTRGGARETKRVDLRPRMKQGARRAANVRARRPAGGAWLRAEQRRRVPREHLHAAQRRR